MFKRVSKHKRKAKTKEFAAAVPPPLADLRPTARQASLGMEEKLLHLWRTPITELPVYKDVPRLIRRTEVVVNEPTEPQAQPVVEEPQKETFAVWLNTNLPQDADDRFRARTWCDEWRLVTLSVAMDSGSPLSPRGSHIPFVDVRENDGLLLFSVPISQIFTVCDSTRYFVIQSVVGDREDFAGLAFNQRDESTAFLAALEEFGRKRDELQLALGRSGEIKAPPSVDHATIRFLEKVGVSQRDLGDPEMANMLFRSAEHFLKDAYHEKKTEPAQELNQLEVIQQIVLQVASRLEGAARLEQIKTGLAAMVSEGYQKDMELLMGSLFTNWIGLDSKTARVFKMINQSVIFIPIILLKTEITKNHVMTKDDTSPDGWKVRIVIDADTVTIRHIRKELPLVSVKPDEKQFWFRWELTMVFDREMRDLLSTSMRITELYLGEGLNPTLRDTLRTILNNGDMLIE